MKWNRKEDNQWIPKVDASWVFLLLRVFSERKKMAKMKKNDVLNSRHYLWICFGIAFHLITGGFGSKGKSECIYFPFRIDFVWHYYCRIVKLIESGFWSFIVKNCRQTNKNHNFKLLLVNTIIRRVHRIWYQKLNYFCFI